MKSPSQDQAEPLGLDEIDPKELSDAQLAQHEEGVQIVEPEPDVDALTKLKQVQKKLGLVSTIALEMRNSHNTRSKDLSALIDKLDRPIGDFLGQFEAGELIEMWTNLHDFEVKA